MKIFSILLSALFIAGCGGGGDSSNETVSTQTSGSASVSTGTSAPQQNSKKLGDNSAPSNAEFTQFSAFLATLSDQTGEFESQNIYLKLYTDGGNTLYLGRYKPALPIQTHIPNHLTRVYVDIFSNDPSDTTITRELSL
ncbi:hypothetical protein [Aestuariibacter salexigens]|uniref:hypothetical protein n=1 Tax=Aestuariibacter salexigens TaxID=226010 RepID=UPI0004085399|nr:hypothetical protein [Aestuariibacter salexigens]